MALPELQSVAFFIPDGAGNVDVVTVDACVSESHLRANTVTDHPVEEGAPISDHSRPEAARVQLECVVSNTPLGGAAGYDYAAGFWQRLEDLSDTPRLIDVATVRKRYTSMAIENVSSPVDVQSSQALKFTVALKHVRIVKNKLTRTVRAKDPRAQSKKKMGTVMSFELEDNRTTAAKLYDTMTGKPYYGEVLR